MIRTALVLAGLGLGLTAAMADLNPIAERQQTMKAVGAATREGVAMAKGDVAFDAGVFLLDWPLCVWTEGLARESRTEASALAWSFGRHAWLLAALLSVHLVSGYAKALIVLEQRRSASLALLSAVGFVLARLRIVLGHFAAVALLGLGLLAAFVAADGLLPVTGYRTQLAAFVLMQVFVTLRIALRLALGAGQLHLLQRLR